MKTCGCMLLRDQCESPASCTHAKPRTAADRLVEIETKISELYRDLEIFEGNEEVQELQIALIDVMSTLDMAMNRARRV